jgi:hypothetical protein
MDDFGKGSERNFKGMSRCVSPVCGILYCDRVMRVTVILILTITDSHSSVVWFTWRCNLLSDVSFLVVLLSAFILMLMSDNPIIIWVNLSPGLLHKDGRAKVSGASTEHTSCVISYFRFGHS